MTEPTWHRIAQLNDLQEGARLRKDVRGTSLLLFRIGPDLFAYEDLCPHKGAPLGDGPVSRGCITCRHHQWQFDIRTGKSVKPQGHKLNSYPVKLENDEIFVLI